MDTIYSILEILLTIFGGAVLLFVVALTAERGTEVVKIVLEWLTKRLAAWNGIVTSPIFKLLLSAFAAWASTKGFSFDFFAAFPLFAGIDPQLVGILSSFIVWVSATYLHPKVKNILPSASTVVRKVG